MTYLIVSATNSETNEHLVNEHPWWNQKNSDVFITIALCYRQMCAEFNILYWISVRKIASSFRMECNISLFYDINIVASRYSTTKVNLRTTDSAKFRLFFLIFRVLQNHPIFSLSPVLVSITHLQSTYLSLYLDLLCSFPHSMLVYLIGIFFLFST